MSGDLIHSQNPFASGTPIVNAGHGSVADTQVAAKELGEVQARVTLAKRFGRDQAAAYDKIMTACQRLGLASVAIYTYARGGTNINGPSIRLAEEIVRDWGNIDCGWVELERNEYESTVRAYAWDLETNAYTQRIFVVPLQRTKKSGNGRITVPLTDERDIYELLANNAARRLRNCILTLIPGDVVEAAVEQCHKTLITKCEINPERIKNMLTAFAPFGVTKAQIETRIQRKLESIAPAQFVRLTEIYNSLKDGMSEPSDWFEVTEEEHEQVSASAALKDVLKATQLPQAESNAKTELPFDTQEQEESLYARLASQIERTRSRAAFEGIYKTVTGAMQSGELTEDEGMALLNRIDEKTTPKK